jgi:endonuclease/exonuclease/phosphatase family metal-dependent hydrolase
VWTKNYIDKFHKFAYVENINEAIIYYKDILKKNIIMIGDFNIADKPDERKRYIDLKQKLNEYNISNRISKDLETKPTFYMHFQEDNSFTNDYCFASETIKISNVKVGDCCLDYSDHYPLIVTLDY